MLQLEVIKKHILPKNICNDMELELCILRSVMGSLTLQDLLPKKNYLKQRNNLKNLSFHKIYKQALVKMMNFLREKYLTHVLIQKKQNLLVQVLMKHITILNQELKGGRMKDQVGLRFQYQNINFLFHKSFFWKNFPLPDELRNAMKRLINTQYEDKEYFRQCLVL